MDLKKSLIDVNDCVLIIIDIQEHFLKKLLPERAELLIDRVVWLMEIAKILDVPMVVTTEEPDIDNGLIPSLAEKLPHGTPVFDKIIFGLADQPDILRVVEQTGRKTAVLVGLETDVCVAHSAIGLLQKGFQVVAVSDATDSPGESHEIGLERMKNAGVLVTSLKALYYEWIRTVALCNKIDEEHGKRIGTPKGITL
ncbi:MAG: isochorismatase family protein [Thermoplasmata archaeon]|nr:isochorismatase family protein [Thermoplasmata archaeon]